jgi:hypothetical protein
MWGNIVGLYENSLNWIVSTWGTVKPALSLLILIAGVALIFISAWISAVDRNAFGLIDDSNRTFWTQVGPICGVFIGFARPLWNQLKKDGHLQHVRVSDSAKTDMKQMAKFMKKADRVTIYSGDFSYIYDYYPLYQILIDLAKRGNLTFISYKNETIVKEASESKKGEKDCIVQSLINANNIFFDVPGNAKFSLVYRRGEEVLLYRHRDKGVDFVTIFQATNGTSKQLVETIKTLVDIILNYKGVIKKNDQPKA